MPRHRQTLVQEQYFILKPKASTKPEKIKKPTLRIMLDTSVPTFHLDLCDLITREVIVEDNIAVGGINALDSH